MRQEKLVYVDEILNHYNIFTFIDQQLSTTVGSALEQIESNLTMFLCFCRKWELLWRGDPPIDSQRNHCFTHDFRNLPHFDIVSAAWVGSERSARHKSSTNSS